MAVSRHQTNQFPPRRVVAVRLDRRSGAAAVCVFCACDDQNPACHVVSHLRAKNITNEQLFESKQTSPTDLTKKYITI